MQWKVHDMLIVGEVTDSYRTRATFQIKCQLNKWMLVSWKETLKFPGEIRMYATGINTLWKYVLTDGNYRNVLMYLSCEKILCLNNLNVKKEEWNIQYNF